MKTIKLFLVAIIAITMGSNTNAQSMDSKMVMPKGEKSISKTETFKVSGKCETCKARIEKTAKVDGVTKAVWNDKTKLLTLAYNPSKVKTDDIQQKLAAVGHDTPKYKATDKAYNALPSCCKYR